MNRLRILSPIVFWGVFWGALWGITEATLGNLLHEVNLNIGWMLWFPVAYFFMNKAYKKASRCEAILLLSLVAAAVKLVDLFMPVRIDKVINPAASILLEGLTVYAILRAAGKFKAFFRYKILEVSVISFSWRLLYAVYVLFLPAWMTAISPVRGLMPFLRFLFLEGAVNLAVIFIVIKLSEGISVLGIKEKILPGGLPLKEKAAVFIRKIDLMSLSSLCLLAVAIVINWVF